MKIKGRDIRFFFLGVLTILIIETILNWGDSKKSFIRGVEDGLRQTEIEK